jgi:hypothetical protein
LATNTITARLRPPNRRALRQVPAEQEAVVTVCGDAWVLDKSRSFMAARRKHHHQEEFISSSLTTYLAVSEYAGDAPFSVFAIDRTELYLRSALTYLLPLKVGVSNYGFGTDAQASV